MCMLYLLIFAIAIKLFSMKECLVYSRSEIHITYVSTMVRVSYSITVTTVHDSVCIVHMKARVWP